MKKIIAISFILLIGLMLLSGCNSENADTSTNQQQNSENADNVPEQNQEQAESNAMPQPPALPGE